MKQIVIVDRNKTFSFPEEIVEEYGSFEIRSPIKASGKIFIFTMDDVEIFSIPTDFMHRASEFQKMILQAGRIPLDSYCAKAIYTNKEALNSLQSLAYKLSRDRMGYNLETVMFLGDTVSRDGKDVPHFSFIKFHPGMYDKVEFLPYEDDSAFVRTGDFPLVFKKKFIAKTLKL